MKRWAAMSKIFARLNKDIILAIKEGEALPIQTPTRLRAVLQNCKAANMPKDNIERAIKKATDKDTSDYKEVTFEGYGPHGIAIFVETATDNNNRTVPMCDRISTVEVDNWHHRLGGIHVQPCVLFQCAGYRQDLDDLTLELIDFGAEEVERDEEANQIIVSAPFESFGDCNQSWKQMAMKLWKVAWSVCRPRRKLGCSANREPKLIEKLEGDDDVQAVFHTMEPSVS